MAFVSYRHASFSMPDTPDLFRVGTRVLIDTATATGGMVVAPRHLAVRSGLAVLRETEPEEKTRRERHR